MLVLRRAVAVVATAVALASCGGGAKDPVSFKGPGFRVDLPDKPKVTEQSFPTAAGDVKVKAFIVEGEDLSVGISVAELPLPEDFDVQASLDAVGQGAAKDIEGTLASSEPVTVQGRAGRDIHVTGARGGKASAWIRVLLDGKTQYQILTTQVGGNLEKAPAAHATALRTFAFDTASPTSSTPTSSTPAPSPPSSG